MMEQILERENMLRAWQRVKTNAGAPGIDGMCVETFPAFSRQHWPRIRSAFMEGTYRPAPVRRVFIPKSDGTQRHLGVPTLLDRVIQQALAQVLTPLFDNGFSTHSYGFREGRNAYQAVRHVEACWKEGRRFAVDCDLKTFFDTVNHDRLMGQLREKIRDRKVLGLVRRYITGWLNYFGISDTYGQVVELAEWVRRSVRLYTVTARRAEAAGTAAPKRNEAATHGSSRGRADAICWPWAFRASKCTWLRAAAKGIGE